MRNVITRTISTTTIDSVKIRFIDGKPELTPNEQMIVSGGITEEKALKLIRKKYGDTAQVSALIVENDLYEISVDDFMKYAKKVEPVTPVQEG